MTTLFDQISEKAGVWTIRFSFGPVECKEEKNHHLLLDEENFNHQNEIKQKLGKAVFNEDHYRERWRFPSLCVCARTSNPFLSGHNQGAEKSVFNCRCCKNNHIGDQTSIKNVDS